MFFVFVLLIFCSGVGNQHFYCYKRFKSSNRRAKCKIARLGFNYPQMQKDITKIYLEIQKVGMREDVTSVKNNVTEKFEKKMTKLSRRGLMWNARRGVELLSAQAVSFKKKRFFEKMCVRIEGKCGRSDDLEPEFFVQYCVFIRNDQGGWKLCSVRRPSYWDCSIYSGRYG